MFETTATHGATLSGTCPVASPPRRSWSRIALLLVVALVVMLALPLYVEEFWLRTGFAVFGAIVGAIGLNLLVGTTGLLSLAHAFFLAVGAVTYVFVSGESGGIGLADLSGLGWPPLVGMIAGDGPRRTGAALQPDRRPAAGHLPGCRLAGPGLHRPARAEQLDVGDRWLQRRSAPEFSLFGFSFGNTDPDLFVIGVPFREAERLWYLGLVLALAAYVFARVLLRSRPGRALQTLRDSEVAASNRASTSSGTRGGSSSA